MGPKQRRSELLTKETPYKPYAGKPHVRICAGGAKQLASLPLKDCDFRFVAHRAAFAFAAVTFILAHKNRRTNDHLSRAGRG